jgi:ribonuclease E
VAAPVLPKQVELTFEPVAEVAPAAAPAVEPIAQAEVHVEVAAPVQVELVHAQPAHVVDTVKSVADTDSASIVTKSETKVEDLDEMLKSAGLVLAATDPEKLRNAQTYAAPVVGPRVPRVRKPPVEISNEPLQLIQTKQP